jgi:hypothetical protein
MSTAVEMRYKAAAARVGCRVCALLGVWGLDDTPVELHHPRAGVGAAKRAKDGEVIPLCPEHHRGNTGFHGMGSRAFVRVYGVTEAELTDETQRLVGWRIDYASEWGPVVVPVVGDRVALRASVHD